MRELGVTSFDHADIYGGYSVEALFGEALALAPTAARAAADRLQVRHRLVTPARPEHRIKHLRQPRRRTSSPAPRPAARAAHRAVELLLIHRPDALMDADEVALVSRLRAAGKVAHFGVSNFTPAQFELLASRTPLVTNQIELHLLQRAPPGRRHADQLQRLRIRPMIWSPLAGGALLVGQGEASGVCRRRWRASRNATAAAARPSLCPGCCACPAAPCRCPACIRIEALREALDALRITLDAQDWTEVWQAAAGHEVA